MSKLPEDTGAERYRSYFISTKEMKYQWKGVTGQQAKVKR